MDAYITVSLVNAIFYRGCAICVRISSTSRVLSLYKFRSSILFEGDFIVRQSVCGEINFMLYVLLSIHVMLKEQEGKAFFFRFR